ncbi:MAG: hypothetical protein IPF88_17765 [Candidatus Microthrix sp.]|nr:hypothetical protein [Candidatus Microthrix sp.]MBK6440354.1 hypothetical protein [Candidatus Microthrix sp.]
MSAQKVASLSCLSNQVYPAKPGLLIKHCTELFFRMCTLPGDKEESEQHAGFFTRSNSSEGVFDLICYCIPTDHATASARVNLYHAQNTFSLVHGLIFVSKRSLALVWAMLCRPGIHSFI